MKKCKECGREETGYGSLLDEDGYCFTCGVKYNREKIKRLQERNEKLEKMAFRYTPEEWNTMLRMIERLQKQLNSANKCIKIYADWTNWLTMRRVWLHTNDYAKYYLQKWGVK